MTGTLHVMIAEYLSGKNLSKTSLYYQTVLDMSGSFQMDPMSEQLHALTPLPPKEAQSKAQTLLWHFINSSLKHATVLHCTWVIRLLLPPISSPNQSNHTFCDESACKLLFVTTVETEETAMSTMEVKCLLCPIETKRCHYQPLPSSSLHPKTLGVIMGLGEA